MTGTQQDERVTGKTVILDAITLFKDAGTLIFELSKTAIAKLKRFFDADKADNSTQRSTE